MTGLEGDRLTPQKNISEGLKEQNERLKPGQKLLLAGHSFLAAFAFEHDINRIPLFKNNLNEDRLNNLMKEYFSIYGLLSGLVGKENVLVTDNCLEVGKSTYGKTVHEEVRLPDGNLNLQTIAAPFITDYYHCWPRDAHSLINGKVLTNKDTWTVQDKDISVSGLGEGGKVLVKDQAILITPDIYKSSKDEIGRLIKEGYRIGVLPFVDPSKQKHEFRADHIDGHASLIKDKDDKLTLVVADSYSRQGNDAMKFIREGCSTIGAKIVGVDDQYLPPLAFNLLQFEDKSIAMASALFRDLEVTLSGLVGGDKVFMTDTPITYIPKLAHGGIRCLTNTIPSWVINNYNSSNIK
jgi:hypothetical protein